MVSKFIAQWAVVSVLVVAAVAFGFAVYQTDLEVAVEPSQTFAASNYGFRAVVTGAGSSIVFEGRYGTNRVDFTAPASIAGQALVPNSTLDIPGQGTLSLDSTGKILTFAGTDGHTIFSINLSNYNVVAAASGNTIELVATRLYPTGVLQGMIIVIHPTGPSGGTTKIAAEYNRNGTLTKVTIQDEEGTITTKRDPRTGGWDANHRAVCRRLNRAWLRAKSDAAKQAINELLTQLGCSTQTGGNYKGPQGQVPPVVPQSPAPGEGTNPSSGGSPASQQFQVSPF